MRASLLDLVAPPCCVGCGQRGPLPWCGPCRAEARALQRVGGCPRCAGSCGPPRRSCPLAATPVEATWAAFTYTGIIARTVVAAKVGGHHAAWLPLGAHLGSVVARARPGVDVVVPITTEPRRARRRGFDHAVVMARQVGRVLDVPMERALRTRPRTPDRGRDHEARELPLGAIRPVRDLGGRHVLLVDDVLTTGATLRAAAAAAAEAGAVRVVAGVLARAGR